MGHARNRVRALRHSARQGLIALCALAVAEFGVLAAVQQAPATTREDPGPYRGTPPELIQAGHQLGIPASAMERLQVRWGLPRGLREPRSGYITAAYHDGHVYIGPHARPADALAYEYLHDVWAHLAPQQRARLVVLLDQFAEDNHDELEPGLTKLVRADVANGATATGARLDELHSIACSRTRDEHLRQDLRAYCTYVLPGRRLTTKSY